MTRSDRSSCHRTHRHSGCQLVPRCEDQRGSTANRDSVDYALHASDSFDTRDGGLTKVIRREIAFDRDCPDIDKNVQFQAASIPLLSQQLNNILFQQRAEVEYVCWYQCGLIHSNESFHLQDSWGRTMPWPSCISLCLDQIPGITSLLGSSPAFLSISDSAASQNSIPSPDGQPAASHLQ